MGPRREGGEGLHSGGKSSPTVLFYYHGVTRNPPGLRLLEGRKTGASASGGLRSQQRKGSGAGVTAPAPLQQGAGSGSRVGALALAISSGQPLTNRNLAQCRAGPPGGDTRSRLESEGPGGGAGRGELETRSPRPWAWEGVGCVPSPWQHFLKSSGN